jgi:DNA-binding transcriptional LysR family regulator
MTSSEGLFAWEFAKGDRELNVHVEGQLIFNTVIPMLGAAVDGLGLAFVPEDLARPYLADGLLIEVLADWCPYLQRYHLYYPSRRQNSPAFAALVEALRFARFVRLHFMQRTPGRSGTAAHH